MSDKNKIPNGWTIATLEDLLDYIQPTNFIVESTDYNDNYSTPVLTAGKSFLLGKTNETNGIFDDLPVIIFDDFTTATKFVDFPFKVKSSAMKILKPTGDLVNIWYVYYLMQTIRVTVDTHKRYWISNYSKISIPFPPYLEQQRIVTKIEELFSNLDNGIDSLRLILRQLIVYRQAVLKWAFEGKLTGFKSCQKIVFVESVANIIDPQPSHRTPPEIKDGIPYVSTKDCDYNTGKIDFKTARKVSNDVLSEHVERYILEDGDFFIGKIGTIGQPIRITLPQNFTLSANVVLIQPRNINKKYLYYYFQSCFVETEFKKGQKATAQAAFGIQKVRKLPIIFPTDKEQCQVVQEIERRISICDKIKEGIEQSLLQAEALRQSILKKAFEGKLVPQDPNDEPASVLLERIKAERENGKSDKKGKGKIEKASKKK